MGFNKQIQENGAEFVANGVTGLDMFLLVQGGIFKIHVSFRGCTWMMGWIQIHYSKLSGLC